MFISYILNVLPTIQCHIYTFILSRFSWNHVTATYIPKLWFAVHSDSYRRQNTFRAVGLWPQSSLLNPLLELYRAVSKFSFYMFMSCISHLPISTDTQLTSVCPFKNFAGSRSKIINRVHNDILRVPEIILLYMYVVVCIVVVCCGVYCKKQFYSPLTSYIVQFTHVHVWKTKHEFWKTFL